MDTADKVKVLMKLAKAMKAIPADRTVDDFLAQCESSGADPEQALKDLIVGSAQKGEAKDE